MIDVSQAWAAKLGSTVNFPLQPQVLGNRVVLAADDGTVAEFDAANGQRLWSANAGDALTAGVGSDGHTSAVVTRSNQVVALAEGRVLWKHKLGTQSYTAPLVAGGRVFVLGADRSLSRSKARPCARPRARWRCARADWPPPRARRGACGPAGARAAPAARQTARGGPPLHASGGP